MTNANNNSRIDLTNKSNTIGSIILDNYDRLMSVSGSAEAYALLKGLFDERKLDTPATRRTLLKLQRGMGRTQTITFISNVYLKAKGLGSL